MSTHAELIELANYVIEHKRAGKFEEAAELLARHILISTAAAGDEGVTLTKEQIDSTCEALMEAWTDIGQWMQLARHQRDCSVDYTHDPLCATDAGMERSQLVKDRLGRANGLLRKKQDATQADTTTEAS